MLAKFETIAAQLSILGECRSVYSADRLLSVLTLAGCCSNMSQPVSRRENERQNADVTDAQLSELIGKFAEGLRQFVSTPNRPATGGWGDIGGLYKLAHDGNQLYQTAEQHPALSALLVHHEVPFRTGKLVSQELRSALPDSMNEVDAVLDLAVSCFSDSYAHSSSSHSSPEGAASMAKQCCRSGMLHAVEEFAGCLAELCNDAWGANDMHASGLLPLGWRLESIAPVGCKLVELSRVLSCMWPDRNLLLSMLGGILKSRAASALAAPTAQLAVALLHCCHTTPNLLSRQQEACLLVSLTEISSGFTQHLEAKLKAAGDDFAAVQADPCLEDLLTIYSACPSLLLVLLLQTAHNIQRMVWSQQHAPGSSGSGDSSSSSDIAECNASPESMFTEVLTPLWPYMDLPCGQAIADAATRAFTAASGGPFRNVSPQPVAGGSTAGPTTVWRLQWQLEQLLSSAQLPCRCIGYFMQQTDRGWQVSDELISALPTATQNAVKQQAAPDAQQLCSCLLVLGQLVQQLKPVMTAVDWCKPVGSDVMALELLLQLPSLLLTVASSFFTDTTLVAAAVEGAQLVQSVAHSAASSMSSGTWGVISSKHSSDYVREQCRIGALSTQLQWPLVQLMRQLLLLEADCSSQLLQQNATGGANVPAVTAGPAAPSTHCNAPSASVAGSQTITADHVQPAQPGAGSSRNTWSSTAKQQVLFKLVKMLRVEMEHGGTAGKTELWCDLAPHFAAVLEGYLRTVLLPLLSSPPQRSVGGAPGADAIAAAQVQCNTSTALSDFDICLMRSLWPTNEGLIAGVKNAAYEGIEQQKVLSLLFSLHKLVQVQKQGHMIETGMLSHGLALDAATAMASSLCCKGSATSSSADEMQYVLRSSAVPWVALLARSLSMACKTALRGDPVWCVEELCISAAEAVESGAVRCKNYQPNGYLFCWQQKCEALADMCDCLSSLLQEQQLDTGENATCHGSATPLLKAAAGGLALCRRQLRALDQDFTEAAKLLQLAYNMQDVYKCQYTVHISHFNNRATYVSAAVAALLSASNPWECIKAVMGSFIWQLPGKLAQVADYVAALLPVRYWCNNPMCANVTGLSEQKLVRGTRCVCAGCKEARYCSSACQMDHWSVHKRVCRCIKAEKAAVHA